MYIINFYQSGNSKNIPTTWPQQLQLYSPPSYYEGSGYLLKTGENAFFNGEINSFVINNDKAGFGIGESQTFMTREEYQNYLNEHQEEYNSWEKSVRNPTVRDETIKQIKNLAQEKIVSPLGYSSSQPTEFLAKQINMNGRASEILLNIILGTSTSGEQTELMVMKSFFSKVKDIRSYSNLLENYVNSGIDIDIYSGWPS